MKHTVHLFLFLLIVCFFSSCVMSKRVNYLQDSKNLPQYTDTLSFEDYKLQRGDYLYIRVATFDEETMSMLNGDMNFTSVKTMSSDNPVARLYLYLVGEDKCIDYPYVGKVQVVGKNLREVKDVLEERLGEMVSGISIDVRLANRSFSVIGESRSGRYTISKEKTTIFEALAMSGDLNLYAKRSDVQIIRQTEEGTVVKSFDLRTKTIIDSEFYYIQPNDVIYIPFADAKYWGATHFTNVLSITFTTVSFGLLIYSIVNRIVKLSNSAQ